MQPDPRPHPAYSYYPPTLYISETTGEVELMTTRGSRALAWVAAIPHWMYFLPLAACERRYVETRSSLDIRCGRDSRAPRNHPVAHSVSDSILRPDAMALRHRHVLRHLHAHMGLQRVALDGAELLGFRRRNGDEIPQALSGGPSDIRMYPPIDAATWHRVLGGRSVKQIEYVQIQNDPYFAASIVGSDPVLLSLSPFQIRQQPFSTESLMDRIKKGNPDVSVVESQLLSDYDSYYHPSERRPPLPVLRVKFADPDATWFYVDPHMGQAVARFTRRERIQS